MTLKLGDEFPNFKAHALFSDCWVTVALPSYVWRSLRDDLECKTTIGEIQLHEWLGDSWGLFCSHPADYTPVCTSELATAAELTPEFEKRNVKVIDLSCDTVEEHHGWVKDVAAFSKIDISIPIIDDADRAIASRLGMIREHDEFDNRFHPRGLPMAARGVFIIGPDKKLKASTLYPPECGRNFTEFIRLIDALQCTSKYPCATPANWKVGEKVMVPPNVKAEEIQKHWPQGLETTEVPSGKNYIRMAQV